MSEKILVRVCHLSNPADPEVRVLAGNLDQAMDQVRHEWEALYPYVAAQYSEPAEETGYTSPVLALGEFVWEPHLFPAGVEDNPRLRATALCMPLFLSASFEVTS